MSNNVGGYKCVSLEERITPVIAFYGRQIGDPIIRDDILAHMRNSIESADTDALRSFLSMKPNVPYISELQSAFTQRFVDSGALDRFEEFQRAKCDLLLQICRITVEDDAIVQHILNYEDFHMEILPFQFGRDFIVRMYELRGLDFFLFHYMGGENSGSDDPALFTHAACIPESLRSLGRGEEATWVEQQIEGRKSRLIQIGRQFQGPEYEPAMNLTERLRIAGEKFWSDYLSPEVWSLLDLQSTKELVDAFSTEYLLKAGVLSNWSPVVLALCKVVERELASNVFSPWKQYFKEAEWKTPSEHSEKARRIIETRRATFDMLKRCSDDSGRAPTIGQLRFLLKFWDDHYMDQCTDAFKLIRIATGRASSQISAEFSRLWTQLEAPIQMSPTEITIQDARNWCAHPSGDREIDWEDTVVQIKRALGKPPVEILRSLIRIKVLINSLEKPVNMELILSLFPEVQR